MEYFHFNMKKVGLKMKRKIEKYVNDELVRKHFLVQNLRALLKKLKNTKIIKFM